MGYELKLFILEPNDYPSSNEERFCQLIAMVDICKPGYTSEIIRMDKETEADKTDKHYFYCCDGNKDIKQDAYGKRPRFRPLDDVLKAVTKDNKGNPYRRYDVLIATLKAVKGKFENPIVAFYGY